MPYVISKVKEMESWHCFHIHTSYIKECKMSMFILCFSN